MKKKFLIIKFLAILTHHGLMASGEELNSANSELIGEERARFPMPNYVISLQESEILEGYQRRGFSSQESVNEALICAARNNQNALIGWLLNLEYSQDYKPNEAGIMGALHYAIIRDDQDLVEYLLHSGGPFRVANKNVTLDVSKHLRYSPDPE